MPPRLPTTSLRSLALIRSYATHAPPPAPYTTPVSTTSPDQIPPSHTGTTSPTSPASTQYPRPSPTRATTLLYNDKERVYPMRKQFLFDYYTHLLKRSSTFLMFEYDNLTVADWNKIRILLNKVPAPPQPSVLPPSSGPGKGRAAAAAAAGPINTTAKLEVVRAGVFGAVSRSTQKKATSLSPWLTGQRAVLHSQHFSPPYIKALLAATQRGIRQCAREGKPEEKQPMLKLVVGLADGRLVGREEIVEISKLPDMDTLRSQLVGLLDSPARGLLGTLQAAGGGGLVRTLQGLEESLKEGEGGKEGGDAPTSS